MQTYEQRLRELAEKMAKAQSDGNWHNYNPQIQKIETDRYLPSARIALDAIIEVEKKLETANGEFNNFIDWLDSRSSTKNIYMEYESMQ